MRESSCPVLTVGPESHAAAELGFRQILYASDFSTVSVAAAPYAFAFSKSYGSRLTLVHALEGLPESPYLDAQMAKVRLRKLVPQGLDLTAKPEIIVEMGPPAKVILRTARELSIRSDRHWGTWSRSVRTIVHAFGIGGAQDCVPSQVPGAYSATHD